MNLLADEVQRHSAKYGKAVMIQDDGKSQNADRLMAFMATRSVIEREMARTGKHCDNLTLMRAIGHIAVRGRAQLGPKFLAKKQDLLDLTKTLQQTFIFKNAVMPAEQKRVLRPSGAPMSTAISAESLMGLTSLTTATSSAVSLACAESLEMGTAASFGSAFSFDSDADPVQAPDKPAFAPSVVPCESLIDDLFIGAYPSIPMAVMEWSTIRSSTSLAPELVAASRVADSLPNKVYFDPFVTPALKDQVV